MHNGPQISAFAASSALDVNPFRLLVVDDSPRDLQLFECLVEDLRLGMGLELVCEQAASGPLALELIERGRYDAVVLDQEMPEMSGREVLAALLRRFPVQTQRPKVLAYSSRNLPEFRRQCLAEGADAFRDKYLSAAGLADVLREFGLGGASA